MSLADMMHTLRKRNQATYYYYCVKRADSNVALKTQYLAVGVARVFVLVFTRARQTLFLRLTA